MPIRKQDYPPDWKEISLAARQRADWQCQWCGAPSNKIIHRGPGGGYVEVQRARTDETAEWEDTATMSWKRLHFYELTRIILTVAHLDRDRTNNDPANLAALCQRCHLNHDRAAQHIPNRKYGRYHDRDHQGKLKF